MNNKYVQYIMNNKYVSAITRNKYVQYIISLVYRYFNNSIGTVSSELAYFFLISIFPLLIVLTQLIRFFPVDITQIIHIVEKYAPQQAMSIIEHTLTEITQNQGNSLLSFSILITIWGASRGVNGIMNALNRAYKIDKNPSFIKSKLTAILMTFLLLFVIIFSLSIPVFGRILGTFLLKIFAANPFSYLIWDIIRFMLSISVLWVFFLFLYKFVPYKQLKFREIWPGAFFATIGWVGASYIFAFYVENFSNYSATYGSLGGIIIMLFWFYLTATVILIGGEMNALYYCIKHNIPFSK